MPSKPTEYLNWNPTETNVIDPPSGLKSTGWLPETQPPSQYTNWQINLIDQWIQWLNVEFPGGTTEIVTSNTLLDNTIAVCLGNPATGSFNVTLPLAAASVNYDPSIKNIAIGSGNTVTVLPSGSDMIEGQASVVLTGGDSIILASDGISGYWQLGT
jgi:hypothetical protein